MRFLVDECTGPAVARWLRERSFEVLSVYDDAPGITDDEILSRACSGDWILITNDKDFGEMIHRDNRQHCGIVLLRLQDERAAAKIEVLQKLLEVHQDNLPGAFVVVTESQVRFAQS